MSQRGATWLRDAAPSLVLVTSNAVVWSYFLFVDDFLADTGPVLRRVVWCLLGFGVALVLGSAIGTFRAPSEPFVHGFGGGMIGVLYLIVLMLLLTGFEAAIATVVFIGISGMSAAALGAILGVIARGPIGPGS